MAKKFGKTEANITKLFKVGKTIIYKNEKFTIIESGKPSPKNGECKTDTYVLLQKENKETEELKISIKQENADFLENKMNLERAIQIFGKNASEIISGSIKKIQDTFENDYLVTFEKYKRTEAKTLKIGWKFELMNKKSGDKSNEILLSQNQLLDIYSGTNLSDNKKNSKVNSKIITESGVANTILIINKDKLYTLNEIIELLTPIEEYVKNKQIFFTCKAINYRVEKNKWDGNRPLSVFINWTHDKNHIYANIVMDKPLEIKANAIGEKIRDMLEQFKIDRTNFNQLKDKLISVKYYPE